MNSKDEQNPALWLATRKGKIVLSYPVGTTRCVPQGRFPRNPYNKSLIDQIVRSRKLDTGLVLVYLAYGPQLRLSMNTQNKELGCYSTTLASLLVNNPCIQNELRYNVPKIVLIWIGLINSVHLIGEQ